jgi:hypothetical protein
MVDDRSRAGEPDDGALVESHNEVDNGGRDDMSTKRD